MNSLFTLLSLSVLAAPANDNAIIDAPVCVACEAHGATRGEFCDDCDADIAAHFDEAYACYSDDEGVLNSLGFNTDPRY